MTTKAITTIAVFTLGAASLFAQATQTISSPSPPTPISRGTYVRGKVSQYWKLAARRSLDNRGWNSLVIAGTHEAERANHEDTTVFPVPGDRHVSGPTG
jgi:hypothetical protein